MNGVFIIKLNEENYEKIKVLLKNLNTKKDRIISNIKNDDVVVIPSNKYPLKNKEAIEIFTREITSELKDDEIEKIYNNIDFKIGKCYSNIKKLQQALLESNIDNFKTYIGWVIADVGVYPVHHCFILYNDKYILDPSIQTNIIMFKEEMSKHLGLSMNADAMRKELVKITKKLDPLPYSKKSTFGKILSENMFYIASECSVEDGEKIFKDLISTYPNHPIYQRAGMNSKGLSTVQRMIEESK